MVRGAEGGDGSMAYGRFPHLVDLGLWSGFVFWRKRDGTARATDWLTSLWRRKDLASIPKREKQYGRMKCNIDG